MDCLSLFGSLIFTLVFTIVLDGYSVEDVNRHSSQGVCEAAQESAIHGNT